MAGLSSIVAYRALIVGSRGGYASKVSFCVSYFRSLCLVLASSILASPAAGHRGILAPPRLFFPALPAPVPPFSAPSFFPRPSSPCPPFSFTSVICIHHPLLSTLPGR